MILPDSSAWVDEIRRNGTNTQVTLSRMLLERQDIVTTEPVVMELLAGARTMGELRTIRARLLSFTMLRIGGLETYEEAAFIWRACREAGEQVRKKIDCLIAAVAIRHDASVLHADRDFDVIARHTQLRIEPTR